MYKIIYWRDHKRLAEHADNLESAIEIKHQLISNGYTAYISRQSSSVLNVEILWRR